MDKDHVLQTTLNTFSIWNETVDILAEMEIEFGGAVGSNLNQFLPVSLMDTIAGCLDGKIEDRDEKDQETGETVPMRYYVFSGSSYRVDDAIRMLIESIGSSESAEQCADKVKAVFV